MEFRRVLFRSNRQILGMPSNAPVAGTPLGVNCNLDMPDAPPTATECNQTQNAKFDYPAWTFGLDWQATDDIFLYAVTRGAAKAGGWNLRAGPAAPAFRSEEHTSELQSLMRISYAVFCLKKKIIKNRHQT